MSESGVIASNEKLSTFNLADDVRYLIDSYHAHKLTLTDSEIDQLLGISPETIEGDIDRFKLYRRYGIEQYIYEGTPYTYIRYFLHHLKPAHSDVIYDLGSGYGRVVLYGALTTPVQCVGIEIVPERVREANEAAQSLALSRATFIRHNVLEYDYSDGTIFFLFNPCSRPTLQKVTEKLQRISQRKSIRVIGWGGNINEHFANQDWLQDISPLPIGRDLDFRRLQIFETKYP